MNDVPKPSLRWVVPVAIASALLLVLLIILLFLRGGGGGGDDRKPLLDAKVDDALRFAKEACLAEPTSTSSTDTINAETEAKLKGSLKGKVEVSRQEITVIVDQAIPASDRAGQYDAMRECIKQQIVFYFSDRKTPVAAKPAHVEELGAFKLGVSRDLIVQKMGQPDNKRITSVLYTESQSMLLDEMNERASIALSVDDKSSFTYATYRLAHFNAILQFDQKDELNGIRLERLDVPDESCEDTNLTKLWPFSKIYTAPLCIDKLPVASLFTGPISLRQPFEGAKLTDCTGFWNRAANSDVYSVIAVTCFRHATVHADDDGLSFVVRASREGGFEAEIGMGGQDKPNEETFKHVVENGNQDIINVIEIYRGVDSYLDSPAGLPEIG